MDKISLVYENLLTRLDGHTNRAVTDISGLERSTLSRMRSRQRSPQIETLIKLEAALDKLDL